MLVKQCCIPSEKRHLGFRLAWLFRRLRAVRQTPACYGQRTPRGSGNTSSTQWHPGRVRSSPPGKKFSDKASKIEPSSLALHFRSVVTRDFSLPPSPAPSDVDRLLLLRLWASSVGITGSCWKVTAPSLSGPAKPESAILASPGCSVAHYSMRRAGSVSVAGTLLTATPAHSPFP